jgi:hypothetical protein
LAEVIAAALMWRLDSRGEPRSSERRRAAELLGQITFPPRVRELVQVAYREARWDRHDQKALEHSDVRMAAVASLLKLSTEERLKLLQTVDKRGVLAEMLEAWVDGRVDVLAGRLQKAASVAEQGIAALALGDLYGRLVLGASPDDQWMASQALNALTAQFQNPATLDDTMWALTYALSMIDLPTVRRALVEGGLWAGVGDQTRALPLPQETEETKEPEKRVAAFFREWSERGSRKKFLAYLIGLTQWQEQPALDFLREQCLRQNRDQCMLAAVAIEALSWVGSPAQDVLTLEKIALFRWEGVLGLQELSPEDREYLQRKAIEALANLGDLSSVERLRKGERNAKWTPGLERALFVTSEKIFWRMRWASEQ